MRLSRTGWELLRRVEDLGPIRVSRLAELMDLSLPVTSRALQRLEDDGLVARRPDPDDGRAARFVATRAGARARARIQAAMHDELATVLAGLARAPSAGGWPSCCPAWWPTCAPWVRRRRRTCDAHAGDQRGGRAVAGEMIAAISITESAGNPPRRACSRTVSASPVSCTQ